MSLRRRLALMVLFVGGLIAGCGTESKTSSDLLTFKDSRVVDLGSISPILVRYAGDLDGDAESDLLVEDVKARVWLWTSRTGARTRVLGIDRDRWSQSPVPLSGGVVISGDPLVWLAARRHWPRKVLVRPVGERLRWTAGARSANEAVVLDLSGGVSAVSVRAGNVSVEGLGHWGPQWASAFDGEVALLDRFDVSSLEDGRAVPRLALSDDTPVAAAVPVGDALLLLTETDETEQWGEPAAPRLQVHVLPPGADKLDGVGPILESGGSSELNSDGSLTVPMPSGTYVVRAVEGRPSVGLLEGATSVSTFSDRQAAAIGRSGEVRVGTLRRR